MRKKYLGLLRLLSLSSVRLTKQEWCTELMIRSGIRGEVKTEEDDQF